MGTFALHRQGQGSQVCTRSHAMTYLGPALVLPERLEGGYRPTELNMQPSTDRRKGFLPARGGRASTLGEIR
jgi:hypothetical protein